MKMEKELNYIIGDATTPVGPGNKIIVHVCNDIGAWGAGFVMALSKKWDGPEKAYRSTPEYILGNVDFVQVDIDLDLIDSSTYTEDSQTDPTLYVANLIGQHRTGIHDGNVPVRYDAIAEGLKKVSEFAKITDSSIHMPRIGSGLAGGNWTIIEQLILDNVQVPVTVYDLPGTK